MNNDIAAIFLVLTFFNYLDKYLTATTLKEWNFDMPKITMKKLVDAHELNPLVRWIMNILGVDMGMLVGFLATEILLGICLIFKEPSTTYDFLIWGVMIGALGFVNVIHVANLSRIDSRRKKELVRLRKMVKRRKK